MRTAVASLLILAALAGCGEKGEAPISAPPAVTSTSTQANTSADGGGKKQAPGGSPAARAAARRRAVDRVVRAYLEALDRRDGTAVCRVLAPGVAEQVKLPRERGSCAASLDASIGYRDPRGLPQFKGVELAEIVSTQAGRRSARVTATVVTTFADRDEPSIEDDILYLQRGSGEWLIAKADAALYRAVGAEPTPGSIVPPG